MAVHVRRREIGVLRSLRATQLAVFRSLLSEVWILAVTGASVGGVLSAFALYLFRNILVSTLGLPLLLSSTGALLLSLAGGIALALLGVTVATLIPAHRISRQEPALSMRV